MSDNIVTIVEGGQLRAGSLEEIQEQIRRLAEFNLPPSAAERYEVVLRGKYKVLRKRDKPIKFIIQDSKYNVPEGDTRLPSEAFFRRSKPSRYNDEGRCTAPSMIDLKECFYS